MPPTPATPQAALPDGPTERLSWFRLGIVALVVIAAGAAAFVGATRRSPVSGPASPPGTCRTWT